MCALSIYATIRRQSTRGERKKVLNPSIDKNAFQGTHRSGDGVVEPTTTSPPIKVTDIDSREQERANNELR